MRSADGCQRRVSSPVYRLQRRRPPLPGQADLQVVRAWSFCGGIVQQHCPLAFCAGFRTCSGAPYGIPVAAPSERPEGSDIRRHRVGGATSSRR